MKVKNYLYRNIKSEEGFTLIELVVVIVILGIIASIAVPKYIDLTSEANQSADTVNEKSVEAAVLLYFAQQVAADPSYTLTAAANAYNAAPNNFYINSQPPTPSGGGSYHVSVVNDILTVTAQ